MQTLRGHRGKVRALAFAPLGNRLVSAAGHGTALSAWDLARGKRSYLRGHTRIPTWIAFTPAGDRMFSQDEGGNVLVWDVGTILRSTSCKHAALLSAGRTLALIGFASRTYGLHFEAIDSGEAVREPVSLPTWAPAVAGLASAPDGRTLAATVYGGEQPPPSVVFLRLDQSPVAGPLLPLDAIPYTVAFSPDGKTLVVGTTRSLERFEVATSTEVTPLEATAGWSRAWRTGRTAGSCRAAPTAPCGPGTPPASASTSRTGSWDR
jgi:WD40 repeat protein